MTAQRNDTQANRCPRAAEVISVVSGAAHSIALLLVIILLTTSCATEHRQLPDVTIFNASTSHLDWVEIDWGGRTMKAGVLPPGVGKTTLYAGLPSDVKTNIAMIHFINEDDPSLNWNSGSNQKVRERRAKSQTVVPVDISSLLRLAPGLHEVTFKILSFTNAEVVVQTRKQK